MNHIDYNAPIMFRYYGEDYECLYMGSYISKNKVHHIILRNKAAKDKVFPTIRVLETYDSWGNGISSPLMKIHNAETEGNIYDNYRGKRQSESPVEK
jgi:hypothetical protein